MKELFDSLENTKAITIQWQEEIKKEEKDVGINFRFIRHQKNITLRECAKRFGISPTFMSDIERGNRSIPNTILKKMRKFI